MSFVDGAARSDLARGAAWSERGFRASDLAREAGLAGARVRATA